MSWRSILLSFAIGAGFGLYMAAWDLWLYASVIPDAQIAVLRTTSLAMQLAIYPLLAVLDDLLWRLICMSALVWLLVNLAGRPTQWCYWTAITLVTLAIYPLAYNAYFLSLSPSSLTTVRELALHGSAGMLWGWLYWRHGLRAAIAGHSGTHMSNENIIMFSAFGKAIE